MWTEATWLDKMQLVAASPEGTGNCWKTKWNKMGKVGTTDEQTDQWCLEKNLWPGAQYCSLRNKLLGKGNILAGAGALKKNIRVPWSGRQLWFQLAGRLQSLLLAQENLLHPWYKIQTVTLDMLGKGGRKIYRFTGHEAQATEGSRWGRRNGSFSIYGLTGREIHSDSNPTPKGTNHTI